MSDHEFGSRPGEVSIVLPDRADAEIYFIGHLRTPWSARRDCPKNSAESSERCAIEVDPRYETGLGDLAGCTHLIVLYWMDRAPRDLIRQRPRNRGESRGVFALSSPARPNPIALSVVRLLAMEGTRLEVVGLDCLDGTPLIDLKPYFASTDSRPEAVVGWHASRDKPVSEA